MGELLAENRRLAAEADTSGRDCWEVVVFLRSELLSREAELTRLAAALAQASSPRACLCSYFSSWWPLNVTEGVEVRTAGATATKARACRCSVRKPAALQPEGARQMAAVACKVLLAAYSRGAKS